MNFIHECFVRLIIICLKFLHSGFFPTFLSCLIFKAMLSYDCNNCVVQNTGVQLRIITMCMHSAYCLLHVHTEL